MYISLKGELTFEMLLLSVWTSFHHFNYSWGASFATSSGMRA